jgi:myo-inositol-1(or 4)-monophosphatase
MEKFLEAAVAMVKHAGAIHMAHLGTRLEIAYKSDVNLVTQVDKLAEEAILARIREAFPVHAVVAEESGESGRADHVWYVDPLDGTTNYAHGFPMFSASVALYRSGEPLVAAVFLPVLGELYTAVRGGGAYLNGTRLSVSAIDSVERSLVATGFSPEVRQDLHNVDEFVAMLRRSQAVRRPGACTIDLAFVACGRFDGFWEYRLAPWDVAGGRLLVEEAGGRVTSVDGSPFDVEGRSSILASNGRIHGEMVEVLASTPHRHQDRLH